MTDLHKFYFELRSFDFIIETWSPLFFEDMEANTFVGYHWEHLSETVSASSFVDQNVFLSVGTESSFEDCCWYLL